MIIDTRDQLPDPPEGLEYVDARGENPEPPLPGYDQLVLYMLKPIGGKNNGS